MIDLHVHILPGVDDGPATMAESVAMCRLAAADGVETMVATSHQRHPRWPNEDRKALLGLLARLRQEIGDKPRLLPGAEISVDSDLLGELDGYPDSSLLPVANSRYLLLEFSPLPGGPDARTLVHELVVDGWRPILAHPERIARWAERPEEIYDLVELGAHVQLTAMSVTGEFGRRAQTCCRTLFDKGLVDFVASDGHNPLDRPPVLTAAWRTIAESWGEAVARRVTKTNPAAVLADRPLEERAYD